MANTAAIETKTNEMNTISETRNVLSLSPEEISMWSPRTQAISILMDAHFNTFNASESAKTKRERNRRLNALRTIYSAAQHIKATR
jgi:hypothetical protein